MDIPRHILLVEDDKNLGYILSEYLSMKGFVVTWTQDGKEAVSLLQKKEYSLAILDVMLPSLDGFSIAEKMSAISQPPPFIFLTAKHLKVDRLKGFKLGCDDYISKPVDEEELVARINAVLKRASNVPQPATSTTIPFGTLVFQSDTRQLQTGEESIILTAKEAEMLQLLLANKNMLLARDLALKQVWGSNDYFNRRSMDVIISRIRKHIAADPSIRIINIHGKGYKLEIV